MEAKLGEGQGSMGHSIISGIARRNAILAPGKGADDDKPFGLTADNNGKLIPDLLDM